MKTLGAATVAGYDKPSTLLSQYHSAAIDVQGRSLDEAPRETLQRSASINGLLRTSIRHRKVKWRVLFLARRAINPRDCQCLHDGDEMRILVLGAGRWVDITVLGF